MQLHLLMEVQRDYAIVLIELMLVSWNGHHGASARSLVEEGSNHQKENAAFQMVAVERVDKQKIATQHHVQLMDSGANGHK